MGVASQPFGAGPTLPLVRPAAKAEPVIEHEDCAIDEAACEKIEYGNGGRVEVAIHPGKRDLPGLREIRQCPVEEARHDSNAGHVNLTCVQRVIEHFARCGKLAVRKLAASIRPLRFRQALERVEGIEPHLFQPDVFRYAIRSRERAALKYAEFGVFALDFVAFDVQHCFLHHPDGLVEDLKMGFQVEINRESQGSQNLSGDRADEAVNEVHERRRLYNRTCTEPAVGFTCGAAVRCNQAE
jgi:hypothetical protein